MSKIIDSVQLWLPSGQAVQLHPPPLAVEAADFAEVYSPVATIYFFDGRKSTAECRTAIKDGQDSGEAGGLWAVGSQGNPTTMQLGDVISVITFYAPLGGTDPFGNVHDIWAQIIFRKE